MGGDELYHYHTKIMMKDPELGGSFEWHQDYGYVNATWLYLTNLGWLQVFETIFIDTYICVYSFCLENLKVMKNAKIRNQYNQAP